MKLFYTDPLATICHGECVKILAELPEDSVDAVLTDPPYSSGGMFRSDRNQATTAKYQLTGTQKSYGDFSGDNRDQRSFVTWATLWLQECLRVTKPGGVVGLFTDWRQLPVMTDALQVAGLVWRGVVVWDKTRSARPALGRFCNQCEYFAWASKGEMPFEGPALWGCFSVRLNPSEKQHLTAKPVALMRELCRVAWRPGSVVLDPFMGSGTTLRAAKDLKIKSIGIELEKNNCEIARNRLEAPAFAEGRKPTKRKRRGKKESTAPPK